MNVVVVVEPDRQHSHYRVTVRQVPQIHPVAAYCRHERHGTPVLSGDDARVISPSSPRERRRPASTQYTESRCRSHPGERRLHSELVRTAERMTVTGPWYRGSHETTSKSVVSTRLFSDGSRETRRCIAQQHGADSCPTKWQSRSDRRRWLRSSHGGRGCAFLGLGGSCVGIQIETRCAAVYPERRRRLRGRRRRTANAARPRPARYRGASSFGAKSSGIARDEDALRPCRTNGPNRPAGIAPGWVRALRVSRRGH